MNDGIYILKTDLVQCCEKIADFDQFKREYGH